MSVSPTSINASFATLTAAGPSLAGIQRQAKLSIRIGTTATPNVTDLDINDQNAVFLPAGQAISLGWALWTRNNSGASADTGTIGWGVFVFGDNADGGGNGTNLVNFINLTRNGATEPAQEFSVSFGASLTGTWTLQTSNTTDTITLNSAGSYRFVPVFWNLGNRAVENAAFPPQASNVTNGTAPSPKAEFYIDADNNVAVGAGPADAPALTLNLGGRDGWARIMCKPSALTASVSPNQGYTDQPTVTLNANNGAAVINPKQIRCGPIPFGSATTVALTKAQPVTVGASNGTGTSAAYHVDTDFSQTATGYYLRAYVGPEGGVGGSTPSAERPDCLVNNTLSSGFTAAMPSGDQAWTVFDSASTLTRMDAYTVEARGVLLSAGYDVALASVTCSPTLYNRGESLTGTEVTFADANGRAITPTSTVVRIWDSSQVQEAAKTAQNSPYNFNYTISATDKATRDTVGQGKHLDIAFGHYGTKDPTINYDTDTHTVSRLWQLSTVNSGIDGNVFTGKASSPTSNTGAVRNRGQAAFWKGYVYNARGQLLASPTVHFAVKETTGSDQTVDNADATLALASGQFTGASATYTVGTADPTGGKTLVVADQTISAGTYLQPRSGTSGTGNFAETSTSSAAWTVSSTITFTTRCQGSNVAAGQQGSVRTTVGSGDTAFTVGNDAIYVFANVVDATGDGYPTPGGCQVLMQELDPNAAVRQTDTTTTTDSTGWTASVGALGVAFDTRTPTGTGWKIRCGTNQAWNGNTGTTTGTASENVTFLSAYTANKDIILGFASVAGVASTLGYGVANSGTHPRPGDRILLGVAFLVDGVRTAPDSSPAPSFLMAGFNQSAGKVEILQPDGTWKDKDAVGYTLTFQAMKQSIEGGLEWIASFGTAGQGVTTSNGYVIDTATWPVREIYVAVKLTYNSQVFYDDDSFLFIGPHKQHPFAPLTLPEANVIWDSVLGHTHLGSVGDPSAAIGDRS